MQGFARTVLQTIGLAALFSAAACGGDDNPYKPQPAWSGKHASLPAPLAPPIRPSSRAMVTLFTELSISSGA